MIITHSPTLTSLGKEEISRNQFRERLTEFRWKVTDIHQDDGEDFYVDIYIDRRNTGVNFYVQLKSGVDLSTPMRSGYVSLDVDVPHLVRWSGFTIPVVLVAWDIRCREGRWVLVNDVIRDLDARSPGWRDGKSRRVRLPWANTTDDPGLLRLRRVVGMAMFPLLAKGRALEGQFTLRFDGTAVGAEGQPIRSNGPARPVMAPDLAIVRLVEGLCTIQERLGMKLPPLPKHLTRADSAAIETALDIATKGRYERRGASGTLTISTDSLDELTQRSEPGAELLFVNGAIDEAPCEVLGCSLPVGDAIQTLKGTVESVSVDDSSESEPPYQVRVALRDVTETWFYLDVLRREAQRLASDLQALFGASQVFLFGSLAWDDVPIVTGDLDLAVLGLPPAKFVDALTWLSRATTFDVDLVDLEGLPPHLRDRVLAEGVLLDDSE